MFKNCLIATFLESVYRVFFSATQCKSRLK